MTLEVTWKKIPDHGNILEENVLWYKSKYLGAKIWVLKLPNNLSKLVLKTDSMELN